MDDAALIFCLRESRLDRLADPSQPVSADNQDILNLTVLKAVEDDVSRHLPDDPIIPNGVVDCIDVEDGGRILSVTSDMNPSEASKP